MRILHETAAETQTVICVGFSKLLLAGIIKKPLVCVFGTLIRFSSLPDPPILAQILETLVILYFAAETSSNQELRQCLTYFFPVYCYSSSSNQRRMLEVSSASPFGLPSIYSPPLGSSPGIYTPT